MTSEEIIESRKEAENAGWVRLNPNGKGPEEWGWCGYRVMRYKKGEWWGYEPKYGYNAGLGISMKTREDAQAFCESHYNKKMDYDPHRGDVI